MPRVGESWGADKHQTDLALNCSSLFQGWLREENIRNLSETHLHTGRKVMCVEGECGLTPAKHLNRVPGTEWILSSIPSLSLSLEEKHD